MTRPTFYPPHQVLEGDDARVARLVDDIRGAFAHTGGPQPLFSRYVNVEEVVRFILLRAEGSPDVSL